MSEQVIKVLFVCMGNICRSPTAEGYFANLLQRENLSAFYEIDSAGTHGYHVGEAPDKRSQAAALRRGFSIGHLRARQIGVSDFGYYDYILVMDAYNLQQLRSLCPQQYQHKLYKFLQFAPNQTITDVPDPYSEGPEGFELVLDLIEAASEGFLSKNRRERRDQFLETPMGGDPFDSR